MKTKHYLSVAAVALALAACDDYDDTALWNQVNDNTSRIEALEQWQDEVNNNIAALQQLLNTNDMITSVTPVTLGGEVTGYTIAFLHSDPITIYHGDKGDKGDQGEQGEQGIQGEPGKDGADGADGSDGKDGYTPQIGLTQQADGNWYWTLDGELMLDPNGDPIRANGDKGEQGEDGDKGDTGATGQPGTPAPTPQIKLGNTITSGTIETDNGTNDPDAWYLSVDNGKTWYRISGDKGDPGATGGQGQQGEQGDSFFTKAPEVDKAAGTVTFYLKGGESFTLPLYQGISISFTDIDDLNQPIGIGEDGTKEIPYTVNGITNAKVTALPTADGWSATVSDGIITVTAGSNAECDLLVTATDNAGNSVSYTLRLMKPYTDDGKGNYTVYTADGLKKMAELANGGDTDINITLAKDITLTEVWTPIGNSSNQYTGTFDGNDHAISGLTIDQSGTQYVGLIGYIGLGGAVKNLKLTNVNVSGNMSVGAVAGWSKGTISGCSVSGNIKGSQSVGGVVGNSYYGNVTDCSVEGMVIGTGKFSKAGGIIGNADNTHVTECHSSAIVEGISYVGGIVGMGMNRSNITACYATGEVKATIASGEANAGGVVGHMSNNTIITACYSTGNVTAENGTNVGGVVGESYISTTTSCYHATGTVSGSARVGGVLGYNNAGTVAACYWQNGQSQGIGEDQVGTAETTKVEDNWAAAIDKMNEALAIQNINWRYELAGGSSGGSSLPVLKTAI